MHLLQVYRETTPLSKNNGKRYSLTYHDVIFVPLA